MSLTRQQYIAKYGPMVIDSVAGTGLFPSVKMAQAILESGNGNSGLAAAYNNHFGIKANNAWQGKRVNLATREVYSGVSQIIKDGFRVYNSALQGFRDHTSFLQRNKRYREAGVFDAKTPEEQARALQNAGYATDPNYANILIGLIERNNLKALDKEAVALLKKKE